MKELLEALSQLEPMEIPAVELYRRRHEQPPSPIELLNATKFMEKLAEKCEKLAERINKLSPVAVSDGETVWEFPL